MNIKILIVTCLLTISNFSQNNLNLTDLSQVISDSNFKTPYFKDSERTKKVETAFPIIEKLFKEYAEKNYFPGLAFGVVMDGRLVYSGSYGFTDIVNKISVNKNSMFRIASMTKSFTAMAILMLRDEGKLKLDDPVALYIPEMKDIKYLTGDAPVLTIEHLLTHASGFPEDNPGGDRQLADTDGELIQLIKNGISFSNTPGVTFEYNNLGFALLGTIITKVSGMPYQKYITMNILKPLKMIDTEWEYKNVSENPLAHGHRWSNDKWIEEPLLNDGSFGAMGGLITSIEDFSKYILLHLSAWPPRSDNESGVLKRSSIREMHKPSSFSDMELDYKYPSGRECGEVFSYSYGLFWIKDCQDRVYISHSGGLPGFGSNWKILPEYDLGIVSFANLTYANLSFINYQIIDTLISIAELKPRVLPPSDILMKRSQELYKLLPDWKNAESCGLFAENFFMDFTLDSLIHTCNQLYDSAGTILNIEQVNPQNQLRGTFVIEGEKKNIKVFFTLTPENPALIQYVEFKELEK